MSEKERETTLIIFLLCFTQKRKLLRVNLAHYHMWVSVPNRGDCETVFPYNIY